MKKLIFAGLILLIVQTSFGQNENVRLMVQSPDGKKVMLEWFVKSWTSDLTGFDIKRKDGIQDWVKLNSEPIMPGISMKKKLSPTGVNKSEESVLKARLFRLLAGRKMKETDNAYFQNLVNDSKALRDMNEMMARDHGVALMNGFAFVDYKATKKTDYQYGLFIQGTDKMLAKVSWNYGEVPDLNTVQEINSKATTKSKGVQVIWTANMVKAKAANVAGFNIYRQGIRLNTLPVVASTEKGGAEYSWNDKSANSAVPIQYSISAESIFGIEGIVKSYTYNPEDHPEEYKQASVTEVNAFGYYFKDGLGLKWDFPAAYERFIQGFYVEKDNMPNGYVRVSNLLEPSARSFTDRTPSPVSSYLRFRIITVYNDKSAIPGADRVYSYFPVSEPPPPQNLRAKAEVTKGDLAIQLMWDRAMKGDQITYDYTVYGMEPSQNKFSQINMDHPVKVNEYTFIYKEKTPGIYKFYVTAESKTGSESKGSDTVSVQFPIVK